MVFEVVDTNTNRVLRTGIDQIHDAEELAAALSMHGGELDIWLTDTVGTRQELAATVQGGCIARMRVGDVREGAGKQRPGLPTQHEGRGEEVMLSATNRQPSQREIAAFRRAARVLCRLGDAGFRIHVADETIYFLACTEIEGGHERHERVRAKMHVSRATGGHRR